MAEKSEKKADAKAPTTSAPPAKAPGAKDSDNASAKGGFLKSTPVLLGIAMTLEAMVLFAGFKYMNMGAATAKGADLVASEGPHDAAHGAAAGHGNADSRGAKSSPKKLVELKVVDFKAPNKNNGRGFLYDVSIYAVIKSEFKEKVEATFTERDALIKDRIRTIIAQCDPEKLGGAEPELVTLRRQVKAQLTEIVGEGLIEEVLVPRCIQYRMDF